MSTRPFSLLSRSLLGAAVAVTLGAAPMAAAAPQSTARSDLPAVAPAAQGAAHGGPAAAAVGAGAPVAAKGTIVVQLDFATLSAQPASRGAKCQLRVDAVLQLAGSVDGLAAGVTTATIDAPCALATSTPPGTYADTFQFTGTFQGNVSGKPATAQVLYAGLTRPGGAVSALLTLNGGALALAAVQARAGESGTYQGIALVPGGPA